MQCWRGAAEQGTTDWFGSDGDRPEIRHYRLCCCEQIAHRRQVRQGCGVRARTEAWGERTPAQAFSYSGGSRVKNEGGHVGSIRATLPTLKLDFLVISAHSCRPAVTNLWKGPCGDAWQATDTDTFCRFGNKSGAAPRPMADQRSLTTELCSGDLSWALVFIPVLQSRFLSALHATIRRIPFRFPSPNKWRRLCATIVSAKAELCVSKYDFIVFWRTW